MAPGPRRSRCAGDCGSRSRCAPDCRRGSRWPRAGPRGGRAGRSACWPRSAWRPRAARTSASISGSRWLYVPTGPEILPVPTSSTACREARPATIDLEGPTGDLQPERHRFGVDRVGPAHHRGVRLGPGAGDQHRDQPVAVGQELDASRPQLEGEPSVDDVAAGQSEVEIAALRPDRLGDLADERDDVVVGRPLDLGDPLDVDRRTRLERLEGGSRDETPGGLRSSDRELDPQHLLEPGGLRPDAAHLGEGIASDQRPAPMSAASTSWSMPMSRRRWSPSNETRSAAASAWRRAASRSGPPPTIVRIRPPPV